jgi:hypothetical protein
MSNLKSKVPSLHSRTAGTGGVIVHCKSVENGGRGVRSTNQPIKSSSEWSGSSALLASGNAKLRTTFTPVFRDSPNLSTMKHSLHEMQNMIRRKLVLLRSDEPDRPKTCPEPALLLDHVNFRRW